MLFLSFAFTSEEKWPFYRKWPSKNVTWKEFVFPHWFLLCIVEHWNTEIVSRKYPKNVCCCDFHQTEINVPQTKRNSKQTKTHKGKIETRGWVSVSFLWATRREDYYVGCWIWKKTQLYQTAKNSIAIRKQW